MKGAKKMKKRRIASFCLPLCCVLFMMCGCAGTSFTLLSSVVFIILIAAIVIIARRVWLNIRDLLSPTAAFISAAKEAAETRLNDETPRSVSGMTQIYLPLIANDFPDFSFPDFRQRAESLLRSYFSALSSKDASKLVGASDKLKEQVRLQIEQLSADNLTEHISDVTVHDTQIAKYEKSGGLCVIIFQTSVGFRRHTTNGGGKVCGGNADGLSQELFDIELVYVRDALNTPEGVSATGVHCPNCGAPVTALGSLRCEYCQAALDPVSDRVWQFNRIICRASLWKHPI